jgi:signal peptidase I
MIDGLLYINGIPCERKEAEPYIRLSAYGEEERIDRYLETLPNGVSYHVLDQTPGHQGWDDTQEFVVPPGHYFMMGDNRDQSNDSRIPNSGVGFVPEENLVGRADLILFSTDGSAKNWEIWKWPTAIRYGRFFMGIR